MKSIEKWSIGDSRSMKRIATREIIQLLAEASGDYNPIHLDTEYAEGTRFKRCIAHALFCLGMISNLIGMQIPGEGAIFLNEKVDYLAPVYIDDEIEAIVGIENINEEKELLQLTFKCINQEGRLVLVGETEVKII